MPKKRWEARVYRGRDANGKQLFDYVGTFDTKRKRDKAVALRRLEIERGGSAELPTCDVYVDRYLKEYGRRNKDSSLSVQTERLKPFKRDFAGSSLDITREEAKDWLRGEGRWSSNGPQPKGNTPAIVSLYNHAIDEDDLRLERNPFRKLSERSKGRSDQDPPTDEEFARLLNACSAMGKDYAPHMRAFLLFAAYTLMRPSEIYPLEWSDIDFDKMRIRKARRLFRGSVGDPKTGPKTIALTPPARDAIMGLPRIDHLVFHSKTGKRLSQPTMSQYWGKVKATAGLDFDLYHATKHYGVHYMRKKLGMSEAAIAAQAGWKPSTVADMLAVYAHEEVGALEEVDQAFANAPKPKLQVIEGGQL
jgi:integrase